MGKTKIKDAAVALPMGRMQWIKKNILPNKYLYLLLLPGVLYLIMFPYRSMYGILMAFKDYNFNLGITRSPFVGLKHFKNLFGDTYFWIVFFNTLKISFGRILTSFPFGIIFALLFNEIKGKHFKKTLQTVYTFPHFLSWVVVSGIVINFLSVSGPLNQLLAAMGNEKVVFLGSKKLIIPILYITGIWKEAGWSSIIYLAAISGIDSTLYEAASIDGAGRWKQAIHVTLPSIRSTILVLLALSIGRSLDAGFDQIFNLSNSVVQSTIDIIDTYIYRITFMTAGDYSYSTALGLFKSVIGFTMLFLMDKVSRKIEGVGIISGKGSV